VKIMANGDITYSNPGGLENVKAFACGSYIGLAAGNIDIICGFTPSMVVLQNVTSKEMFMFHTSMASTYGFLSIADGTRTFVQLGSSGVESPVVLTPALSSAGEGFRVPLGTTTAFNTDGEVTHWQAWR
jgi:hypothetical protein